MAHQVLRGLLYVSFIILSSGIGIDDKLDFGNDRGHSAFRSVYTDHNQKNAFVPIKYTKTVTTTSNDNTDDFENIGVICATGGCNITNPVNSPEDTVKTNVVVHVETSVDKKLNKTEPVGDTPDIPIVIGYAGAKLDATSDDQLSGTYGSNIPGSTYGSKYPSRAPSFVPLNPVNRVSSYSPVYSIYNPSSDSQTSSISRIGSSRSFYNPHLHSRTNYVGSYNPSVQSDMYPNPDRKVNINIKTLPPIAVSVLEDTMKFMVPYYNSYNNHYYGENPPQQYPNLPRESSNYNPVEFKPMKTTWTSSGSFRRPSSHRHTSTTVGNEVKCNCQNGHTSPGLRWYSNTNRRTFNNDPGSQIDDKLAPLD